MKEQNKYYIWGVLLLCLFSLSSCRLGRRATPTPIAINLPGKLNGTPVAPTQTTYTVQAGEVEQSETYTGRVVPAHQEDLFFRRSGRVAQVYGKDGDKVQAGDIIATLDDDTLQLDLESAQLGMEIAQKNLDRAKTALTYDRRQAELNVAIAKLRVPVLASTAVTLNKTYTDTTAAVAQNQLELAQLALESLDTQVNPVLELNLKQAEIQVKKVKQQILFGQLKAPFSGEIRFINLPKADEQVAATAYAVVARVVDTATFQIELNLPRIQLEPLREGMPVKINAVSLNGVTLNGEITALPRPFGTSSGSLVEVALAKPADNAKLSEGITVAVNVALQSRKNALVIPRSALREKNQVYSVILQEGDQQREVTIAVGIIGNDQVEVLAGLEAGQVIVSGAGH
ncbi:MAG: HlyD family efflux transporter periplasmic adaptor subunit [Caldilineaceae bacterium]